MFKMRKEISYCVFFRMWVWVCLSFRRKKIDICYLGQFTTWNVYTDFEQDQSGSLLLFLVRVLLEIEKKMIS